MKEVPADLGELRRSLCLRTGWEDLAHPEILSLIEQAREEDLEGRGFRVRAACPGDATGELLPGSVRGTVALRARETGVIAGVELIALVGQVYGLSQPPTIRIRDGEAVAKGDVLAMLTGPASDLLQAERVLLNFLQRLSGIATETRRYVEALGDSETILLDTRKTTPGWRALEKFAVSCGGGYNHRRGLYDRIMLKDNHLAASGRTGGSRLAEMVRKAREARPDLVVEVEVDHRAQIEPVIEACAHVLLLDNFSNEEIRDAVALVNRRALIEASGGISLERLPSMRGLGLDFLSSGATIHHASWLDLGLDWEEAP